MSRRKCLWKRWARQAGDKLDRLIPGSVKGEGTYLTCMRGDGIEGFMPPFPGTGKGAQVCCPMTPRKEELVRRWAK